MDADQVEPGTPTAGSPEVRDVIAEPVGRAEPAGKKRRSDISFDEAAREHDHGHYNPKTKTFE